MFIPLGVIYALIPVLATGAIGFLSWVVIQLEKHATLLAKAGATIESQGSRLQRLEGFQDGVQFGRAVERANPAAVEH